MVQAGATFHLRNPAGVSSSVADVKLFQSISLQEGLCRHEITIWTSSDHRIVFSRQARIRIDQKKLIYLLNLAFQLLGMSAVGFALCFCDIKQSLDFGLPAF